MEDKSTRNVSQLFNFTPNSYLERTSRPVYALVFLLPFIVFYELGTVLINTDLLDQSQVRVVTFVWLQRALEYIGLGGKFAWVMPPLFVVVVLIGLQTASRKSWRFYFDDIGPMFIECAVLAVPLIVLSLLLNSSRTVPPQTSAYLDLSGKTVPFGVPLASSISAGPSVLADIVTGVGAGIYEELVFRLILICLLMMLFQDVLRFGHSHSIVFSIIVSAALFSAHHHIVILDGRLGFLAPINLTVFIFRTVAGVYFAVLYAMRGFGITAGTHACYDIIATLINAAFFSQ